MKKETIHNITSPGFKTPKNYFDTFENKLLERISEKDAMLGIETTGYKVPNDYFNSVEATILSKIETAEKPIVKLKPRTTFYYMAGIAASLLLLFAIFINNEQTEETFTAEMVEAYFEESDLSSYDLAQLFSETDLLDEDFKIINTPYEEDNLELYLLENSDVELIME